MAEDLIEPPVATAAYVRALIERLRTSADASLADGSQGVSAAAQYEAADLLEDMVADMPDEAIPMAGSLLRF